MLDMKKSRYHSVVKRRTKLPGGKTIITYRPTASEEVIDCAGLIAKTLAPIVIGLIHLGISLFKDTKEDARIKQDKIDHPEKWDKIAELEAEIERLKKESH